MMKGLPILMVSFLSNHLSMIIFSSSIREVCGKFSREEVYDKNIDEEGLLS